jgi:hypothetical protein
MPGRSTSKNIQNTHHRETSQVSTLSGSVSLTHIQQISSSQHPSLPHTTPGSMSLTVTGSLPLPGVVDVPQAPIHTRRTGTLVKSEEWWRDHYYDIEIHGYKLRPRYHPLWEPSWIRSNKDFYSVEDGQPMIVSWSYPACFACLRSGERLERLWTLCVYRMTFRLFSKGFLPMRARTNSLSPVTSRPRSLPGILITTAYHFWTSLNWMVLGLKS